MNAEIIKKLSANDVGETGGHQAGILVPKDARVLAFFPALDPTIKNPRQSLVIREATSGARWDFNFIYYNNQRFGGTRNEYRLTCMTAFLRSANAKAGDELVFARDENWSFLIDIKRENQVGTAGNEGVLVLSGGWKLIDY